ncbi:Uma2 family endonuclease [Actinacidiphila yeochonensis]|uniref:Uma2 family endonuclease n=1 Tax=Actinacidiphila yeochonensis TaxID=89050 RepID=UPI00056B76F2|nr:Uma2 family endonuclease [Actinacidiphila yeochonensis]
MDYERLHAIAEELANHAPDTVRGYEIADQGIVMMAPPSRPHEFNAFVIRQQLDRAIEPGLVAHTGGEVEEAAIGRLRRPDVIVIPFEAFSARIMSAFSPADVACVVEIVSPTNHTTDYIDKVRDYAAMGIDPYLVIDPRTSTVTVFTDPSFGESEPTYRGRHDYAFGDKVAVGTWTLDTSELQSYPVPTE